MTSTGPDARAIRAADLRNATYKVGADERTVTLVDGVDTDQRGRVTRIAKGPLYADVNGDGFDDAALELSVTDGNGFEALWYVLVWDRGRARQVVDPFARTARCGDTVTSVAARAGAFEVRERRIDGVAGNCARPGGLPITRSVVVDHGYLRQRAPDHGYGGICPAFSANREVPATGTNFRIGPSAGAPEIGERVRVLGPTRAAYGANAHRVGWRLIGYAPPGEPIKLFGPCTWLPTAEAPSGA